jgi:hypothetical protein
MPGWGKERANEVKEAFYEHLKHTQIKSKEESNWITLGDHLYNAQIRVIEGIFDALARDIHSVKILKSRQLGVSTIIRALMLFWSGIFNLTGALVFHRTQALDDARTELIDMLERMPPSYRFPRKKSSNRFSLSLDNRSRIAMMSAGEKETKGSNSLGASFAISLAHRSELCSYGNRAGLEAMRHSMARTNPNRLFVDESTARGRNLWFDIWSEAKKDPECVCIFIGWWSHPAQRVERNTPSFEKYTRFPLSAEEKHKIRIVKERYGHDITVEQLAWIRKEMDLDADEDDPEKKDFSGDPIRKQEQPWYEEESWQSTEAAFFDPEKINDQANKWANNKYTAYTAYAGFEFTDFRIEKAPNQRSVQLKVWEDPVEGSVYIVACDPAYGINEHNDRSCVQVLRAYSDGLDQVAEYAWPLVDTQQLAWVMAALEGWYAGETSEVYRIIEINGPGEGVYRELRQLKQKIQFQYFGNALAQRGLMNIQRNVRDYLYQRSDSMTPGHSLQFRTHSQVKVAIMERLRDHTNSGVLRIRSHETLEEMCDITREGDTIGAGGSAHDDRVLALALGARQWEEGPRRRLMAAKRTREAEVAKRRMSTIDLVNSYNQNQLGAFLAGKDAFRRGSMMAVNRGYRGRR